MTNDEFAPLVRHLEAIVPLPPLEREFFLTKLRTQHLDKGEFFLRPGFPAFQVGFLLKGFIRYYYVAPDGREFIKHFCFDGHFVSSYAALAAGTSSDYWIEALEPTVLLVFSYRDWMDLLHRHPVWGIINGQVQAEALVLAEKRERSLILDSAKTRYLNLLAEVPGIESRVKQYDLANYLGITPVALSRIRGKIPRN